MKIKKILVSQPAPENGKSPYFELAEKNNLQIDFRPFIHIEGIPGKEFRQERIDISEHSAVIFTSKTAVDHFFRICEELRITVPDSMKYFCISESTAFYLQKYIVYRKRKIFYGNGKFSDLMDLILKHKEETYLVPLSDFHKEEIPNTLRDQKIKFSKAIIYRTVCSDLADVWNFNFTKVKRNLFQIKIDIFSSSHYDFGIFVFRNYYPHLVATTIGPDGHPAKMSIAVIIG